MRLLKCIGSTWFISADMQLHILSVVVILFLLKKTSLRFVVKSLIVFVFTLISALIIIQWDFTPGRVSTQFG